MLQTAEVQKLDSIQIWLNAMAAPESNELFRSQIGDQIISLPFYEVSSVELERLTRQSNLEFVYNTPHIRTQPLSLKPRMSPVKDQNPRGTCSVFAAVAMLEFYHPGHIFSEQCLAKFSSNEDPGSTKDRIFYAVGYNYFWGQKIGGLYHNHDCPYNPNSRDQIPNLEEIQRTCKNIKLSGNLGKKLCAGHAIVVTGYDDRDSSFQFKNSWGKTRYWPEGYGKMSYAYYLKMRMDSFIISK